MSENRNKHPSSSPSGDGGCPVDHSKIGNSSSSSSAQETSSSRGLFSLSSWWGSPSKDDSGTAAFMQQSSAAVAAAPSTPASCPMEEGSFPTPASLEEAAKHAQTPQPDQSLPLRTERQVSSIPRGDVSSSTDNNNNNNNNSKGPHHQQGAVNDEKWVYPSEQQLYNAMRRKGWQNVPEDSISAVLHIHNNINEGTWRKIQDWEGSNQNIKLAKFQGRPSTLTPKAFFLTKVLRLYDAPFDRHDWHVENRETGSLQRYVIDYYTPTDAAAQMQGTAVVDVRPALDDGRGVYLRGERLAQETFPGIAAYYKRLQKEAAEQQGKSQQ